MKHFIAPLLLTAMLTACTDKENPAPTLQQAVEQSQKEVEAEKAPVNYIRETPVPGGLTPERINSSPALGGTSLSGVQIAPSGEFVTVLQGRQDDARQKDLWAYDLETKESRQVTATKGFETDPKVSANGSKVAYVRGNELYIKDLKTGLERQLSDGSSDTIRNATASFVVQEELARNTGYWVSRDAKTVAYTQIDESAIAIENRIDFGADGVKNVAQRYPFAGTDNATVKLGFVSAKGGKTRWVALDDDPALGDDIYLTRVAWAPDNRTVFVGVLARNNKIHRIYKIDSRTGEKTEFYEETSPTWLNIRSHMSPTKDGGLIWSAERNDKRQLFNIDAEGSIKALTPENLNARSIACRTADALYVSGWTDSPLSNHIFKISQSDAPEGGQTVTQITSGPGIHSANFNSDCTRYLGSYSDDKTPTNLRAYEADGTPLAWLNENKLDAGHAYAPFLETHINPEYGQLDAEDGTKLDYMLFKPTDLKPGEKRPVVTIVYNGPGVQRVQNRFWRKDFSKMLAHHGFVVFTLDGRGASNRGKSFEDHLYRSMGQAEVADQAVGARWLAEQDFVDGDNMGIYGWSYGGYMTLHMLAQTDLYKSGVSGAPVTDWSLYDTAYTERFLGDPNTGAENYTQGAYENGSVFKYIDGLTEPVLLIHGMADDNVVFRHSIKFMAAMQKKNKHNLRIQTYPGEKHGFRKTENRIHRDRQILEFFSETLAPE